MYVNFLESTQLSGKKTDLALDFPKTAGQVCIVVQSNAIKRSGNANSNIAQFHMKCFFWQDCIASKIAYPSK